MYNLDKIFITAAGICGLLLSVMCVYRYFTYVDRSYVELLCAVAFFGASIIAFNARRWCK